ncbi:hypothetical protein CROQUDRAFT_662167 [Cronartium quercuum f. sp. fusiforme G11]|uniref:LIM zinc-binding domain-containing protein n=1 Tax=Cronartium quercuum f. sp. fusiforme G11 TaxID=708437 RepID=A0A9P6T8L3_9BASI|nr:hypothetical protein CROQUDRAFT_662167 [Cronartium quercuum f. sp. fusiforme G11]
MTTSDSSILTGSSQASRSRMPFLEKYAQLVQTNNNTRTPSSSTPSLDKINSKDRWNESSHSRNLSNSTSTSTSLSSNSTDPKRTIKPKISKKVITPPTSPEISPSDKIGFASLQRSQLRNDRSGGLGIQASNSMPFDLSKKRLGHGDEYSRTNKPSTRALPASQSASAGLDKLLASDAFQSSNFDTEEIDKRFETPKSRSKGKSSKKGDKDTDGLEDLMGDLLSEMSRKAEKSTYQLKEKRLRKNSDSTSTNYQSRPNKYSPHQRSVTESDTDLIEDYDRDMTPRIRDRKNSTNDHLPIVTPDSPGIRPSDSISQLGFEHPPSPPAARALFAPKLGATEDRCQHCGKRTDSKNSKIRESSIAQNSTTKAIFCHSCYAELYLPKCRKCDRPIERSAVTDRVGKVLGKYHPDCFNCSKCSAKFPNGEFYVWDRKPVCSHHYHRLAGTVCANESCGRGIEGPCVSLSLESNDISHPAGLSSLSNKSNVPQRRLYHPEHFTCTRSGCKSSLEEFHFVINFQPWCERHAHQQYAAMAQPPPEQQPNAGPWPRQPPSGQSSYNNNYDHHRPSSNSNYAESSRTMERRRTIIRNVRDR